MLGQRGCRGARPERDCATDARADSRMIERQPTPATTPTAEADRPKRLSREWPHTASRGWVPIVMSKDDPRSYSARDVEPGDVPPVSTADGSTDFGTSGRSPSRCPACGHQLSQSIAHVTVIDQRPPVATPRWDCAKCGWSSVDSDLDTAD
jgi:hypothetical protein